MTQVLERPRSGFVQLIGGHLVEAGEDCFRMSLRIEDRHTNPNGVMHSGVITALMDEALGGVIAAVRGFDVMATAPHATVDVNVSFISAARPGDDIVVEARPLKVGRSVAFGEAEVRRRGEDTLLVKGRFTFAIMQRPAA